MDEMTVASVMTTRVVTVVPATPFRELVATMAEHGVSALPVVDRGDRPIGVVSEADVLAKQEFHGGGDEQPHDDHAARDRWFRAHGRTAGEVMTSPVRAVHADEPVSFAARVLAKAGLRRLYVIDFDGRLVGVVARRDLLRVYLRADDELMAEVTALLEATVGAPGAVEVRVHAGLVTVTGAVACRQIAEAVVRAVRSLPGVVGVHDNLRHPVEDVVVDGARSGALTGAEP